jgi:DNA invertase Pin-like site-specific DNA recombinase
MAPKAFSYLRMSTEQQLKGDSLRRQKEKSQAYAQEHGLVLVESLQDIGVSAFRGANKERGALREFLDLVEEGRIEKGSYLLLESLDRLSREQLRKAMPLLLSLINAGIIVVTLCDGKIYDEHVDDMDLMQSLLIMSRSHEESRIKSQRVKAAWEQKRKMMSEKPLTANCPGWLRLDRETGKFEVIPERAAVVRRIFDETLAGLGRNSIAKRLNADGIPPFSPRGKGWHPGTVQKVRHNPAVMGYFPPGNNRIVGTPFEEGLPDYYPVIIPPAVFHQAQAMVTARRGKGGPRGKRFSNLFQHLTFCAVCGSKMTMLSPSRRNNRKVYVCDSSLRGLGCNHKVNHKANWIEEAFFDGVFFSADYSRFDKDKGELQHVTKERDNLAVQLAAKRQQAELLLEKFSEGPVVDLVVAKLRALDAEIRELEETLLRKEQALNQVRHGSLSVERRIRILQELAQSLEGADDAEKFLIRAAIAQHLKSVVSKVLFFPERRVQVHIGDGMYHELGIANGKRLWYIVQG